MNEFDKLNQTKKNSLLWLIAEPDQCQDADTAFNSTQNSNQN